MRIQEGHLRVSEAFYSMQGEGATMGVPAFFIRLQGCNLMCGGPGGKWVKEGRATWHCDTEKVWKEGKEVSYEEICRRMEKAGVHARDLSSWKVHLVWTGGEPMAGEHPKRICGFLDYLQDNFDLFSELITPYSEIETNGTITPDPTGSILRFLERIDQINCSPKLSNSGIRKDLRIVPEALSLIRARGNSWFKFVVSREEDVREIEEDWIQPGLVPRERIFLMPGVESREELLRRGPEVARWALDMKVRYSSRMHLSLWDRATGV